VRERERERENERILKNLSISLINRYLQYLTKKAATFFPLPLFPLFLLLYRVTCAFAFIFFVYFLVSTYLTSTSTKYISYIVH